MRGSSHRGSSMKRFVFFVLAVSAAALLLAGCNCGNNPACGASTCATCESGQTDQSRCAGGTWVCGWDAGRATVDLGKYSACIDAAYPANTCVRDVNDATAKCTGSAFVTPLTPAGSLCTGDGECLNGFCTQNGTFACGTCNAYLAVN